MRCVTCVSLTRDITNTIFVILHLKVNVSYLSVCSFCLFVFIHIFNVIIYIDGNFDSSGWGKSSWLV